MTGTEPNFPFPDPQHPGPAEELCAPDGRFLRPVVLGNSARALLVCGYDEIRDLLTGTGFSRARAAAHGMTSRTPESLALNGADPPDHARRRGTVAAAFTRARAEKERAWIRQTAEELVATMTDGGPPADLIAAFSLPLSVAVICRVMGVPADDFDVFAPMFDVMMSTQGHAPAEVEAAHRGIFDYFSGLYDRALAAGPARAGVGGGAGVLATMVTAAERDGTVTRTEAVHIAYGLLVAGYETTSKQIATTVLLLLSDRSRWDRVRRDPAALGPAIEETLRWTSLLATGGVPHVALGDAVLGQEQVQAGQILIPVFAAANRDPRVFADPDRLSPDRADAAHVAFGYGRHLCLGAALARVELAEALGALLRDLPGLELAVPERALRWREGAFIRGLTTLPVRW
jgi:cytochrome P450